ncbi:FG-GAP repeat domain-containing protein [Novosphingobium piscinae]|uniref:VCBS repeat-containing protein n=1 Tax=Novosphingobium piscinae TaxID=1507448 RepID=A0A7X1FYN5_9SPHN|nr:VCBS repeat-containing protein [Novosphingobium piscinae]MBC2669294.1 VCBS repeat-containing protein [Novosphingobium piscinae]
MATPVRCAILTKALGAVATLALASLSVSIAVAADSPVQPVFTPVQPQTFAAQKGLSNAWADFDLDGDLDLAVSFVSGEIRLYRNEKGVFTNVGPALGLPTKSGNARSLAWGDYDGDGFPDLYVGTSDRPIPTRNLLFHNNAGAHFTEVAEKVGVAVVGATTRQVNWIDYDADGDLDLFVTQRQTPNVMLRNNGGIFTNVTVEAGLYDPRRTVAACWYDFDRDGDLDVFIGNQEGDKDGFFVNDNGKFHDSARELGLEQGNRSLEEGTTGCSLGDYDNDGQFELLVAGYGDNVLYRYDGRHLVNIASQVGLTLNEHQVGSSWGDFDMDGRIDFYVTGFRVDQPHARDHLYRNSPTGFVDVLPDLIRNDDADHGVQWADFDGDGDPDLALVNGYDADGHHPLFRNDTSHPETVGLSIRALDAKGLSTRSGAEIRVLDRAGRILGSRIMNSSGGYGAQNDIPVLFAVPQGRPVDIVVTYLTRAGRIEKIVRNVNPAQFRGRSLDVRSN